MNLDEIKNTLRDYLFEKFDIERDDEDFTDDVNLFMYGYVDSFGAAEIISFIEQKFNIKITNKDLVKYPMNTISEIADFIKLSV